MPESLRNESSGVLEPTLTKYDKRVLSLVPTGQGDELASRTTWQIAQEMNELDTEYVHKVLHGLHHFGYIACHHGFGSRPHQWFRTRAGDEAIA